MEKNDVHETETLDKTKPNQAPSVVESLSLAKDATELTKVLPR
jgi:hypothetical protein